MIMETERGEKVFMKKTCFILAIFIVIFFNYNSFSEKEASSGNISNSNTIISSGLDDSNYVELVKLNDNIWIHVTYANYNGVRVSSNGMVVLTKEGLVLVDTPWNNDQTKELLKLTKQIFQRNIQFAIITHAHSDRIGGIDTLIENNIDVRSTELTIKEALKNGFTPPLGVLEYESTINIGDTNFETYYPGEGHSPDNIIVWLPEYKVLFGGCLIKSLNAKGKGSITDANLKEWPNSVQNVLEKYPMADIVIPGHGLWGNIDLIAHTLELLQN